jgi:predicted tellurium resistance membrane protein TerC
MFEWMMTANGWAALGTLTALEIILGVDNVIFISILVSRLPAEEAKSARAIGLLLALVMRVALLFALTSIIGMTAPVFTVAQHEVSWRDIVLLAGGVFLIVKATHEIHGTIEGGENEVPQEARPRAYSAALIQIALIDLVFSIDSIVTAVGMAQDLSIMVAAVIISMLVMYAASGPVSAFIERHPSTKVLALAFLLLIGVTLVMEGAGIHIPRGYIYGSMAFAAAVEALNLTRVGTAKRKRARRLARHSARAERFSGEVTAVAKGTNSEPNP